MPIEIVEEKETLTYESSGSKIFYRRIPNSAINRINKKHTRKGKPDWAAISNDILAYIVQGWENVVMGGKIINFDQSLVPSLPSDVVNELLDLSGAEDSGEAAKNLKTLSPSNSSTKSPA